MPDSSLCFRSISIDRLYGIQHDIHIDGFKEGINVIHGPNASGKTMVAHAIRALLWPEGTGQMHPIVSAAFGCDGAEWTAELEGSRRTYQRDGAEADRPVRFPRTHQDRYHLYLHDLLASVDGPDAFAEAILQEAAGGFNLQEVAERLGFEVARRTSRKKEAIAVKQARGEAKEARQKHENLDRERRSLKALRQKKEEARQAAQQADALDRAIRVAQAQRDLQQEELKVESFPEPLVHIRKGDVERLEELNKRIEGADARIDEATKEREEAEEALASNLLPRKGLPEGTLEILREKIENLDRQEQRVREAERKLEGARAEEEEAWQDLAFGAEKEKAAQIDLPALNDLERTVEQVATLRAKQDTRDYLREIVGELSEPQDRQVLRKGMEVLHSWLLAAASPEADLRPYRLGAAAAGLVLIALGTMLLLQTGGAVLAMSGVVVMMGVVVVLIAASLGRALKMDSGDKDLRKRDYERLELEAPPAWTREDVRAHTERVIEELAKAEVEAEKETAWERWEKQWEILDEELEDAEETLARQAKKLGIDDEGIRSHSLFWLTSRLAAWQKARSIVTRQAAELAEVEEEAEEQLEATGELLEPYGLEGVHDAPDARAARDQLAKAKRALQEAKQQKENAAKRIEQAGQDRQEASKKRRALFERVSLEEGEEAVFQELCSQYEGFQEAIEERQKKQVTCEARLNELEQHPAFEEDMAELSELELQGQLEDAQAEADQFEEIAEEITRVEQRIEQAEEGHEVEEKQAAYRLALRELQEQRKKDYKNAVGSALADVVRDQTRDRDLPAVFHRAHELFAEITSGRYELKLDRQDTAFRAYDTVQGKGLPLEALSSGTKVQLLLAVRVAFVDTQEQGHRLPLVLDEVLANSDDSKVDAIIDALHTIAKAGRQIIYLTAQEDEVVKWHEALQGGELPFELISLEDRVFRPRHRTGEEIVLPQRPSIPQVDDFEGISHEEYREIARVPGWSPRDPVGALHLWYLIDDVPVLHRLLDNGIAMWGALQNIVTLSGSSAVDLDADTLARVEARAEALEAWREAWQIGRGRPVDRQVLEEADGVSETKIDEVAELAASVAGDGEQLVQALDDGEVAYFRSEKTEDLRRYLVQEEYIDYQSTLTPQQMWQRVIARVGDRLQEGVVDAESLHWLFRRFDEATPAESDDRG